MIYDLKKEMGLKDEFFEKKIFKLIGFETEEDKQVSDKNLLEFHLSHRTLDNFEYTPDQNTSKKYGNILLQQTCLKK